jgi:hypothetical protein
MLRPGASRHSHFLAVGPLVMKGGKMVLSRRDLLSTVGSLAVWTLCELAVSRRATASTVSPILTAWLREVDELARSLGGDALTQAAWRSQMESLYGRVPFSELLKVVDLDALARDAPLPTTGESQLSLPRLEGLPARPAYYGFVGGFRAGRSIPPHAHNHLVSSFLVLQGELRGRHFDRLRDEEDSMAIAATSDRVFRPGDFSTVTQGRNNVHWFTARTDHSFILDIGVADLAPAGTMHPLEGQQRGKTGRIYVDVDRCVAGVPGAVAKARRLTETEAYRRYG